MTMATKSAPKLNGILASVIYGKVPVGQAARIPKKHERKKMEGATSEMKPVSDDVDKESRPVKGEGYGGSQILTTPNRENEDAISLSQMPNVVNNKGDNLNEDTNFEDLVESCVNGDRVSSPSDSRNSEYGQHNAQTKTQETETSDQNPAKSFARRVKLALSAQDKSVHMEIPSKDPTSVRKDSLTVPPVGLDTSASEGGQANRRDSNISRQSLSSQASPRSHDLRLDYVMMPVVTEEKKSVFSQEESWIRVAIPYLPLWVAVVCLILNIVLPGAGTVVSGLSIFCCGTPRVPHKYEQDNFLILCVNTWVGVAQLFTVTFLLVGWFWSLAWGIKMVIISVERKRELEEQRARELQAKALDAFNMALQRQARY